MKNSNTNIKILERFKQAETDDLPEFSNYDKPLEMGLWILWVAKEKLNIRKLTAAEIVDIIVGAKEVSINNRAIVNAFNRAKKKIHVYSEGDETYYEIMNPGKEHLVKSAGSGSVNVYYFEPERKFSSKMILRERILNNLKGELKTVDPYCDSGTLDILSSSQNKIKFITQIEKLRPNIQQKFLRDLQSFKSEYPNIEFRNYSNSEIHDRYIVSKDKLVILGHSLKDLGAKESFAIVLDRKASRDVFDALMQNFDRRWKAASPL